MKKNIIMITITLVCSMSLLLVLYIFNTKDVYYVSDKIIDNNEITMQIKSGSTYTAITKLSDLNSAKYYRISTETNCSLGSASFYYSNNAKRLKIKVTSSPLKCKIVFEEIKEDINIVAIYVNGVEQITSLSQTVNYYLDTTNSNCSGGETISFDNSTKKISINPLTSKTYCNVYLKTGRKVNILVSNGYIEGGYTLTNEIVNGNFEAEFMGWAPQKEGTLSQEFVNLDLSNDKCPTNLCPGNTKSVKNTGTAYGQQGILWYDGVINGMSTFSLHPKTGHIYYASIYYNSTNSAQAINHIFLGQGGVVFGSPLETFWQKRSAIGTCDKAETNNNVYMAIGWVSGASSGVIWLDDVMLIDFTETFGIRENYDSYKTLVDQMYYFEPYGSIKTEVISNLTTTYQIYSSYLQNIYYKAYTLNSITGPCTVSGNTLTIPSGSTDLTCIVSYS